MANSRDRFLAPIWRYLTLGIASLVLLPVLIIFASWLLPLSGDHWSHLRDYVLSEVVINTFVLLFGVGIGSAILGTIPAWICTHYEFFGSKFFRRALLFPFAIPSFVTAFVYVGLLDYSGLLRSLWRELGFLDAYFPEVRGIGGAVALFSLSLYPYVFALSYNAFSSQGRRLEEAARSLGHGTTSIFFRLDLPFARPWIIGGVCLVGLEVLNDFGTVTVLGVQSFTTAIYKAWFAFFSPETAAQLSSLLIVIAFAVYSWDQSSRRKRDYNSHDQGLSLRPLPPLLSWASTLGCGLLWLLAFVVPLVQIIIWAYSRLEDFWQPELSSALIRTLILGLSTATVTTVFAAILVFTRRSASSRFIRFQFNSAQLGYGIPGSVIAVGVFLPLAYIDRALVEVLEEFGYQGGLILTGTVLSMILALTVRFLAVSVASLDAGMSRIPDSLDEAAGLYGKRGFALFRAVHWPLLKNSFAAAFVLAFVDIIKEMPLTLITRPFGWDTLTVRIYSFISEGEWEMASVPALLLILLGILPFILLTGRKS